MTDVPDVDWAVLAPALAPAAAAVVVLLLDAVRPHDVKLRPVHDLVALAGLLLGVLGVLALAVDTSQRHETLCSGTVLTGLVADGQVEAYTGCAYVASALTSAVQLPLLLAAVVALLLAVGGRGADDRPTHHVLLLSSVCGAMVLAGGRDLALLVVGLETVTVPAIALAALRRDRRGATAALTLLVTAVTSLGLLLLGVALLLAATGSLDLGMIADVLGADPSRPVRVLAALGLLLGVAGIGFKLSAVPFHWWTPSTYADAPTPVAAYLALVSKAAGLVALIELLVVAARTATATWAPVVGVLALVTMTVGNVVALRRRRAVGLLAWSAVAQAGWLVLPLATADGAGADATAVSASVGYLAMYLAATAAAFAVVVVVGRRHADGEAHTLDAYRGLARRSPLVAVVLGLALLCLAGLPPGLSGLVAKVLVFGALVHSASWAFAAVAVVNVVLAIVYYVRWAALLVAPPLPGAAPLARTPVEHVAPVADAPETPGGTAAAGVGVVVPTVTTTVDGAAAPAGTGPVATPVEALALALGAVACVVLSLAPQLFAGLVG